MRALLDGAGYREEPLATLLGGPSLAEALRRGVPALARRTGGGSPLDALARLFLGGLALGPHELVRALGERPVEALRDAGLLESVAGGHRAAVHLRPTGALVLASDRLDRHAEKRADFVMGAGAVTRLLADLTIRRPVASTLDLGCGCGILGFLASSHSGRVVAADLNPRAIAFTRFNAELNGLDGVETAEGDLFAAARGERFDLIVCNPPFVLSPGATFLYRDGGGGICERIAREAPAHLNGTGCLQMLANWPEEIGRDWRAEVARWFEGSPCDAWVLRLSSLDAATYANVWLAQEFGEREIPADAFAAWMEHLESLRVASVGGGLVVMRPARGREPWVEIRDAPPMTGAAGESIARTFDARDLAASAAAAGALLGARLVPSPDLVRVTRERPTGEGWERAAVEMRLADGFRFSASVDPVMAALIGLLDGERTLDEALELFAERQGVSPEIFREDLPRAAGRLLRLGLLIPARPRP